MLQPSPLLRDARLETRRRRAWASAVRDHASRPLASPGSCAWTEYVAGVVLAIDVLVVFVSVVFRYFLHDPFDWAEEVARADDDARSSSARATVLARSQHVGVDLFRGLLPAALASPR